MSQNDTQNYVIYNVTSRDLDVATHEMKHFFELNGQDTRAKEVLEFAHFEGIEHYEAFRNFYMSLPNSQRYDVWKMLDKLDLPIVLIGR